MSAWLACTGAQPDAPSSAAHPAQWPLIPPSPLIQPRIEAFVAKLLEHMSLEEKIGQMVQADIASITPDDLRHYKLGSILAGGLSAPDGNLRSSPSAWLSLVSDYKKAAVAGASTSHPAIPILFGIDAVHGNAKIRGATIFPHNIGLGATHDPDLIRRIGEATAQEVAAIGADWAFAPTVAVVRDTRWGRTYESYSDDPDLVATFAAAMVTGLQGALGNATYFSTGHVLSSAKHFLGDGGTDRGRDQGDTLASEAVLRDVHGAGYRAALTAGVASVMASYNAWHGEKLHANTSLLTGVLKQRWQFGGFVVGDWNAHEEIPGCTKFSCAAAVNAGIDMVMAPDSWKQMYASLLDQAHAGVIPLMRIDDAVRRILRVKALVGLIGPSPHAHAGSNGEFTRLGAADHRALAREAVRKSLVLLKNNRNLLPIVPGRRVLVVGEAADRIGDQCGGWTVDWQGAHNANADIAGATSIFAGIKAAVELGGGTAQLSPDGAFTQKPDVAIVVFGETPYAEFEGDRETLALPQPERVIATLRRLHDQRIPVVSVLLSGRPLWVNPELNLSDSFVAAWLPGGEGEGVADLLIRPASPSAARDFTGRLSFPWPATAMPVTYDAQSHPSGVLFARGYGLSAASRTVVWSLPESAHIPATQEAATDVFYGAGRVVAPWSVYVSDSRAQVRLTGSEQTSPAGAVQAIQQGDWIRADWSGKGEGTWWIGDTDIDLSALAKLDKVLNISYRVDQAPAANILLGMQCGVNCAGWLDVTDTMTAVQPAKWNTLRVPLACFGAHGAALEHIAAPFALRSAGRAALTMREISLVPGQPSDKCPSG